MRARTGFAADFRRQPSSCAFIQTGCLVLLLLSNTSLSHAEAPSIPWECSTYNGAAQTRCLNTLIELQRENIAQLEDQLRAQKDTVNRLKSQVDRQAPVIQDLQQRLSDHPTVNLVPTFSPFPFYPQLYPPGLGFGIHFRSPWSYGPLHLHGPLWRQPYYRSWLYFR